jgi:hypothetical protein
MEDDFRETQEFN